MANQSLYNRYRPQRFSELKGQDHVVRALRDSVASDRQSHAYLFSGPRGTGKTTTARILAKALNCEQVVAGEPCCVCESCKAVEHGTSFDVHELDAASNRGIDAIRELVERASLSSPGRHKVYILDEVHMLTKEASAALLKTLEEPPQKVVFVLATTDPQKVVQTIRSRTQHLQFHLLANNVLAEHVRWVVSDAGLELSQEALDVALVQGGGSVRDTLSALELLAATGGDISDVIDVDEFLQALIQRDPARSLTAMAHAVGLGRDPLAITNDIVQHLRNAFLSLMAPELVVLPPNQVTELAVSARELGAAGLVRAIERLGSALVDMRHAPDPRLRVEVALVQLTNIDAATDLDALVTRIERLEQAAKTPRPQGSDSGHLPPAIDAPPRQPARVGGAAQRPTPAPTPPPAATVAVSVSTPAVDFPPTMAAPSTESVPQIWERVVRGQLKPLVRALFSAGSFQDNVDGVWQFTVPNAAHGGKCEAHRTTVEKALSVASGAPVAIAFIVRSGDDSKPMLRPELSAAAVAVLRDEELAVDTTDLTDAPAAAIKSPIDRLAEAFPGSELLSEA